MRNRSILITVVLVLCLVASNAGAQAKSQAGKKTLTLLTWGNTENETRTTKAVLEAYPELGSRMDISVVLGGAGDANVAAKFRLALAANDEIPDIIMLNFTQVPEFAEAGVIEDLTDITKPYIADIIPGVLNIMNYKGRTVAFPYDAKSKIWFYRKDMFDAAGIDPAKVKTVDDFIAAGKKLQAKFPNTYIWNMSNSTRGYDMGSMFTAFDSSLCDSKGVYNVATNPGVRKAFETMKKLKDSGVVSPIQDFTPDWEAALSKGALASELISGWFKVFIPRYAPDQVNKWSTALWPEAFRQGSPQGGAVFVVPVKAANKALAKEFLTKMRLEKAGSLAVYNALTITPVLQSCATDPAFLGPTPFFSTSLLPVEFESYKSFKVFPYNPASSEEMKIMAQYLDGYLNGTYILVKALNAAQNDLVSTIGNPFKR